MEELEQFIEKCQQFVQKRQAVSIEVFWVDPKGEERAVVSLREGTRELEVDWRVGRSYHIRAKSSHLLYGGALNDPPKAEHVFAQVTALLDSVE